MMNEAIYADVLGRNFNVFQNFYIVRSMAQFKGCGQVLVAKETPIYMKTNQTILHSLAKEVVAK